MKKLINLILISLICTNLFALSADEIAKKYEDNIKYDSSITTATLTIKDNLGTSKQSLKSYTNKDNDTLIEITSGPDRGQKILRKDTQLYLYYPDADQIIRLQGSSLKESFMGSDFSYEDLSEEKSILENYDATLLDEDDSTYTLLLTATSRKMTYQKEELIINKDNFTLQSAILKSSSNRELRSLVNSNFQKVGNYYVPFTTVMKDLIKRQGETRFDIDSIEIDVNIDEDLFTKENLSW
jgi:outer membrane lipoprotein-sorting protein